MKIKDIKPFTRMPSYAVHVSWDYLEEWIKAHEEIVMEPDFQRAHVWTEEQQIRYVEYALRDGAISGLNIYWNHPGWGGSYKGDMVIVDGKQRLNAALRFIRNEIPAYGLLLKEYEDELTMMRPYFIMNVNNLKTRKEMLQWYLDFNTGGIAHTSEEIERVQKMLDLENRKHENAKEQK